MAELPQYGQGAIVINSRGNSLLSAPATVINDLGTRVDVVNEHGRTTLSKDSVQLQAESISDALASVAQQRDQWVEAVKDDVRSAVMESARNNGYADDMRRVLERIGIPPKQNKVKAVVQLTVEVFVELNEDSKFKDRMNRDSDANRDWWDATIRFEDASYDSAVSLKEDDEFQPGSAVVNIIDQKIEELTDISYVIGED
ncbi:hypothetical protein SEA_DANIELLEIGNACE_55 [Arthrobacter phage DanielleIgnace]|nr:hypothetical protein SEA_DANIELLEIGNACE_55 [Arthrobacter phage DanielleIgnace]